MQNTELSNKIKKLKDEISVLKNELSTYLDNINKIYNGPINERKVLVSEINEKSKVKNSTCKNEKAVHKVEFLKLCNNLVSYDNILRKNIEELINFSTKLKNDHLKLESKYQKLVDSDKEFIESNQKNEFSKNEYKNLEKINESLKEIHEANNGKLINEFIQYVRNELIPRMEKVRGDTDKLYITTGHIHQSVNKEEDENQILTLEFQEQKNAPEENAIQKLTNEVKKLIDKMKVLKDKSNKLKHIFHELNLFEIFLLKTFNVSKHKLELENEIMELTKEFHHITHQKLENKPKNTFHKLKKEINIINESQKLKNELLQFQYTINSLKEDGNHALEFDLQKQKDVPEENTNQEKIKKVSEILEHEIQNNPELKKWVIESYNYDPESEKKSRAYDEMLFEKLTKESQEINKRREILEHKLKEEEEEDRLQKLEPEFQENADENADENETNTFNQKNAMGLGTTKDNSVKLKITSQSYHNSDQNNDIDNSDQNNDIDNCSLEPCFIGSYTHILPGNEF